MDSRPTGAGRIKIGIIWVLSLVATAVIVWLGSSRMQNGVAGNAGDPAVRGQMLVAEMRMNLARASELEKCAIVSDRDEESATFTDGSRAASAAVERDLDKLRKLIGARGSTRQREVLGRFESSWKNLKQIDSDLLLSAAQNTNVKAIELSGTIGADLIQKFHDDLAKAAPKVSPLSKRTEMEKLAGQAENAMLNIALLQMRHIHALSAADKRALEPLMDNSRKRAESLLKSMEAVGGRKASPLLNEAATVLGEFMQLNEEIVRLSKIDSNAASAETSLGKRRLADTECDRLLKELQKSGS